MRVFPFDKRDLIRLGFALIVPLLPLALTMFSFEELLQRLLKLLM
jgi:hypothetical protein